MKTTKEIIFETSKKPEISCQSCCACSRQGGNLSVTCAAVPTFSRLGVVVGGSFMCLLATSATRTIQRMEERAKQLCCPRGLRDVGPAVKPTRTLFSRPEPLGFCIQGSHDVQPCDQPEVGFNFLSCILVCLHAAL